MALEIKESWMMQFILDPVLSAYAIMGAQLDDFQAAKLRYMWFCPQVIDDSGVSVGKTELLFIWANLRAILLPLAAPLPGRIVSVYYQTLGTAQETFWPKFDKYIQNSKIFERQLKPGHGGKYGRALQGCLEMNYRNGSKVQCPAGDFANDSKNQASKRFNDLGIDESKEIDKRSNGINRQLIDRATAPCFNQEHPLHANHIVLMGHAEDPITHPSYTRRNKVAKRMIRDGSQDHVILTSSFRDMSPPFAKKYRPDKLIRQRKLELSKSEFEQQWEGIWSMGSKDWYTSGARRGCLVRGLRASLRRESSGVQYVLGWDTAPGMTEKADWNSGTIYEVQLLTAEEARHEEGKVYVKHGKAWRVRAVYSVYLHGVSGDQLSGFIHGLHRSFGFSRIVMDPGGGGAWVYKKLKDNHQLINGVWQETAGLCSLEDSSLHLNALPIVCFFKRGDAVLDVLWEERSRAGDEGIIEEAHREFRAGFNSKAIQWPMSGDDLSPSEWASMEPELATVMKDLDKTLGQIGEVKVLLDKNGDVQRSGRGFLRFSSKTKKDGAYAALYGWIGVMSLAKDMAEFDEDDDDGVIV